MVIARVQLHDDLVWYGIGDKSTKCSNTTAKSFVFSGKLDNVTDIYVIGFSENAELITSLYERYQNTDTKVWLGTPMPFIVTNLATPVDVLDNIGTLHSLPASLGGWHRCSEVDYATAQLQCAAMSILPLTDELILSHPLYKPMSFISGLDTACFWKLVALIGDPRWFIDPQKPNKSNKLIAFLGLKFTNTEKVIAKTFNQVEGYSNSAIRCWYTLNTWSGGAALEDVALADSGNFLWHKVKNSSEVTAVGMHKASRAFIAYLVGVWLDAVSTDELFVPKYFFEHCYDNPVDVERTSEAFKSHMLAVPE